MSRLQGEKNKNKTKNLTRKNTRKQAKKSKNQQKQIPKCFRYQSEHETTILTIFKN